MNKSKQQSPLINLASTFQSPSKTIQVYYTNTPSDIHQNKSAKINTKQ